MIQAVFWSLAWWLIAQVLGLVALPVTRRILRCLPDAGYAFSKTVGLLLASYLLWLGASTGLLVNDQGGVFLVVLFLAGGAALLEIRHIQESLIGTLRNFWSVQRRRILAVEILFFLALVGWTLLRAYAPSKIVSAYGEKYMEIAFLNGILRSPHFPPIDPWLSGYAISYYYFGYVMMAALTQLSGAAPTIAFDLYDALLFALTACGAFGVVSNLVSASHGTQRASIGFGLLGAVFVTGMGNLEGLIHGLYSAWMLPENFIRWLDIPNLLGAATNGSFYPGHDFYSWWWWNASRVINDMDLFHQPTGLEPITEFPFFSFLLGDNHPHKMALPFVLLAIGMAFNLLQFAQRQDETPTVFLSVGWNSVLRRSLQPETLAFYGFYALALGGLAFLNTWDFPIYLGLVLFAHFAGRASGGRASWRLARHTLRLGVILGAAAILLYLLFYTGFSSQAGGILPYIFPPTRLPQYLVMFGPFVLILACFLSAALHRYGGAKAWQSVALTWLRLTLLLYGAYILLLIAAGVLLEQGLVLPGGFANPDLLKWTGGLPPLQLLGLILSDRLSNPWTFLVISILVALSLTLLRANLLSPALGTAPPAAVFAMLAAVTGLALTLSVDFIYLRDFFGARMNTVFKFYFQGWVLMACASAYAVWWLMQPGILSVLLRLAFQVGCGLLVTAGLVYSVMGAYSRVHGFTYPAQMDAGATIAGDYPGHWNSYPDDWAAIQWMRSNLTGLPVLLEASQGSYHHAGRFSAFTGFPSVLGWDYHEYQWRGTYQEQSDRLADIQTIYTTRDEAQALALLRRWNVSIVIVGRTEREFIESTCQQPEQSCNAQKAVEKFKNMLTPLFSQGETTIFSVPDQILSDR